VKALIDPDTCPPLAPGQLALWLLPLDSLDGPASAALASHLSRAECARNAQFTLPHLRQRDAACRGLLRELLGAYLQVAPVEVELVRQEHGKPVLCADQASLHFSYSHSGNYVAYGFSVDGELGVDIEDCSRVSRQLEIARSFFHEREYRDLLAMEESQRRQAFFRYWTLKEAWLKARGEGIFAGLDQFSFDLGDADEGEATVRLHGARNDQAEPCYCYSQVPLPGYRLGLVVRGVGGPLSTRLRHLGRETACGEQPWGL